MPVPMSDESIEKIASYVASAQPQLEKAAAEKQAYTAAVPAWVDQAITAGVISAAGRDVAITQLRDGGVEKLAGFISLLAGHATPARMGEAIVKAASEGGEDHWDKFAREMLDQD
jgi:hypothetical protein